LDYGVAPLVVQLASSALVPASSSSSIAHAVSVLVDDVVALRVLGQLCALQQTPSDFVSFSRLEACHLDEIRAMERQGALTVRGDDFGELEIAPVDSGIRAVSVQKVGLPSQVFWRDEFAVASKLDLVLALLRKGWVAEAPAVPYAAGGDRKFLPNRVRPTSYFHCLLMARELFRKGVPDISHDLTDIHYQCMLRLHGDALLEFLRRLRDGIPDFAEWARASLRDGVGADEGYPVVEDGGDGGASDEGGDDIVVAPPAIVPAILDAEHSWRRAKVQIGDNTYKVYVDNYSHQTGRRRVYIDCGQPEHHHCLRYFFCDEFGDREQCFAHVVAWARLDGFVARDDHIHSNPSSAAVGLIREAMVLEAF
jgi:hypothetical protein